MHESEHCYYCATELTDRDRRGNGCFVRLPHNGEYLCRNCSKGGGMNDQKAREDESDWKRRVREGKV